MSEPVIGDKNTRVDRIRAALAILEPIELDLIDESHKHVGHAGARDGRGHFALRIASRQFEGIGKIACHRKVYAALEGLLQTDIHALSIETVVPHEIGRY